MARSVNRAEEANDNEYAEPYQCTGDHTTAIQNDKLVPILPQESYQDGHSLSESTHIKKTS